MSIVTPSHRPHPRVKFSSVEDAMLTNLVNEYGENNWEMISKLMPNRNPRQCRERWTNYLSPTISKSPWTPEEDRLLQQKHQELGPKWVNICKFFPNRTDTMLKNRFLVLTRRAAKLALKGGDKKAQQQAAQQNQQQFIPQTNEKIQNTQPLVAQQPPIPHIFPTVINSVNQPINLPPKFQKQNISLPSLTNQNLSIQQNPQAISIVPNIVPQVSKSSPQFIINKTVVPPIIPPPPINTPIILKKTASPPIPPKFSYKKQEVVNSILANQPVNN